MNETFPIKGHEGKPEKETRPYHADNATDNKHNDSEVQINTNPVQQPIDDDSQIFTTAEILDFAEGVDSEISDI